MNLENKINSLLDVAFAAQIGFCSEEEHEIRQELWAKAKEAKELGTKESYDKACEARDYYYNYLKSKE